MWHTRKKVYGGPRITLEMTDRDVVERVAQLMRAPPVRTRKHTKERPNRKTSFGCSVSSNSAADLMRKLLPHMGARRAAKIRELLSLWDNRPALAGHQRVRVRAQKAKWAHVVKGQAQGRQRSIAKKQEARKKRQLFLNARILQLVEQGLSPRAVADTLNVDGISTYSGRGRWWKSIVSRVVKGQAQGRLPSPHPSPGGRGGVSSPMRGL